MELDYYPLPEGPYGYSTGRQGGWIITSYFGGRIDPLRGVPGNHGGQDIAGAGINGAPFYAVVDGYVSQGWDPGGGGNWTTLYATNGARFGYGHAQKFAPGVNGRNVAAGTLLGYVGTTGGSTGPHLHFAYDSEDAGGSYNDPYDVLQNASNARRFVGENSAPKEVEWVREDLTMAQFEDIMAGIARLEKVMGTNLSMEAGWHNDTRVVVLNGIEYQVSRQAGAITEAGWSSRPYPFEFEGAPEVFYLNEDGDSVWIRDPSDFEFLTKVRLNPNKVKFPMEAREAVLENHPLVGKKPDGWK